MSAKKDFYLAVRQRLEERLEGIYCRLYNSQFDEMESENTFPFPCVFLEFTQLDWQTKSEGYQEADTIVRLHVGFESVKTEELAVLDLLDEIHAALQGFYVHDLFKPMDRNFEGQDTNHDNVIVWNMDYDTLISDNAGNRNNDLVETTIGELELTREAGEPWLKRL